MELCAELIDEELEEMEADEKRVINLLKPQEIKSFLDQYVIGKKKEKKGYNAYATFIMLTGCILVSRVF